MPAPGIPDPGHPFILVARDLAPADTATINPERVLAFVTAEGGPTSHTAILARALGIPAVVSCPEVLALAEGTVLVLDGATGTIDATPDEATVTEARDRAARAAARNRRWEGPGATADGRRIKLLANIGDPAGAKAAAEAGAEGVGLFRTEFLFLDRADEPSESEQTESYTAVFGAFGEGTKIVVRTLDAGADKPLPFLDQGEEANPALGVRGLRIGLAQPEVLDKQLRAIAAAARSTKADVWVMAPMVAVLSEAQAFDRHAREAGLRTAGVMVEIPAAALSAGRCSARSTSSASAPTTSRSTPSPLTGCPARSPRSTTRGSPRCSGSSAWWAPPAKPRPSRSASAARRPPTRRSRRFWSGSGPRACRCRRGHCPTWAPCSRP